MHKDTSKHKDLNEHRLVMPFLSAVFQPGKCVDTIEAMEDKDDRTIARCEYLFFSGRSEEAAVLCERYIFHEDPALRLSACLISGYANLSLGNIEAFRLALESLEELMEKEDPEINPNAWSVAATGSTAFKLLLHLPVNDSPRLIQPSADFSTGCRLFRCYVLALEDYLNGEYGKSLGGAEAALTLDNRIYPVPFIYLHVIAAISLMNLKRTDEAKAHFMEAWELAYPDKLFSVFSEHYQLLMGLNETCIKKSYPEEYKNILNDTRLFFAGWCKMYNSITGSQVAADLTNLEFIIAMLASKDWTNKEIAAYMELSVNTIKYHVSVIYQKLGITSRKQLKNYLLK